MSRVIQGTEFQNRIWMFTVDGLPKINLADELFPAAITQ